jgi:hypothetical protein
MIINSACGIQVPISTVGCIHSTFWGMLKKNISNEPFAIADLGLRLFGIPSESLKRSVLKDNARITCIIFVFRKNRHQNNEIFPQQALDYHIAPD